MIYVTAQIKYNIMHVCYFCGQKSLDGAHRVMMIASGYFEVYWEQIVLNTKYLILNTEYLRDTQRPPDVTETF